MPKIRLSFNNSIKPGLTIRDEVISGINEGGTIVESARPVFDPVTGELIALEISGAITDDAAGQIASNPGVVDAVFVPGPRTLFDVTSMEVGSAADASFFVGVAGEHKAIVDYRSLDAPKGSTNAGTFVSDPSTPVYTRNSANVFALVGSTVTFQNESKDAGTRMVATWDGTLSVVHVSGTLPTVGDFIGLEFDPLKILPREREFQVTTVVGSAVTIVNPDSLSVPIGTALPSIVNPRDGKAFDLEGIASGGTIVEKNINITDAILGKQLGSTFTFGKTERTSISLPPGLKIDGGEPPGNITQATFWMATDPLIPNRISFIGARPEEVLGPTTVFSLILPYEDAVKLNYVPPWSV